MPLCAVPQDVADVIQYQQLGFSVRRTKPSTVTLHKNDQRFCWAQPLDDFNRGNIDALANHVDRDNLVHPC